MNSLYNSEELLDLLDKASKDLYGPLPNFNKPTPVLNLGKRIEELEETVAMLLKHLNLKMQYTPPSEGVKELVSKN